jgi:hypothetical protein
MPLSAILQLYRGHQFYRWRKPEYLEKTTVEFRSLELEGTVKICSSYRKFEPPRSRNFREKKSGSDPGQFHYALITDAQ